MTFPKRRSKFKKQKDLYGIWYVTSQLGAFSDKTLSELYILKQQYPKWFKKAQRNLHSWITDATIDDWDHLEMQDPFGELKKTHFRYIIEKHFL